MEAGSIMRFLDRHPWVALAAGVGVSTLSIIRIRRDRRERREMKQRAKADRARLKAERNRAKLTPGHTEL